MTGLVKQSTVGAAVLILMALVACAAQQTNENGAVSGELGGRLDEYLTRITPFGFSGAVLVAKDGEIILNKGYGLAIRSESAPNTAATVFSTGSITKQFTAAAVVKLEMQGKLKTEDFIGKYFESVPEDKTGITLHHLLTHTAGLVVSTGRDYEQAGRDEVVRRALSGPVGFRPGERFEYTNTGYSLLAAIVEIVSGQPYEQFLSEQFFTPAGMTHTGYRLPKWEDNVVAHWYVGETDNGTPLEKPYPYWNLLGNGGILSTTGDMYRWHLALLSDKILSKQAREKLFTPSRNEYAYGWDVLDSPFGTLIQHNGGSMLGNSAEVRRYIDSNVVTILFCNQAFQGRALLNPVRDRIERLAFGGSVTLPPAINGDGSVDLQDYAGTYELPSGGRLTGRVETGWLTITPQGQDALDVMAYGDTSGVQERKKLNDQAVAVFRGMIQGDYEPFKQASMRPQERVGSVRQLVDGRLAAYRDRIGAITDVVAVGTFPSGYEANAAETVVELRGEKESIYFLMVWREGKNIGVAPAMPSPPLEIPFLPMSETRFAGYHLGMAENLEVDFDLDQSGAATAMRIGGLAADRLAEQTD
ncbi:MAG TPA: serine hydrolase domain-containing protein [Acidobacteriota bacterium]|nr:serine hydrolase domain-containing protein [Acidobacteriota bacterium]